MPRRETNETRGKKYAGNAQTCWYPGMQGGGCDTHKWDYTSFCQTYIVGGIYVPSRTVFETWWHIFFHVFFSFPLSFLPSTINRSQSSLASTSLDVACDSHDAPPPFKKSTCEYASWITRFCSSLKTTPHNGSHERTYAQHLSSFHHRTLHSRVTLRFSPAGPKTSPFQSHSTLLRFSSRLRSR